MSDYLQHSIAAIRYQMKALDEALNALDAALRQEIVAPKEEVIGAPTTAEKREVVRCPWCHGIKLSPLSAMGPEKSYYCEQCDFQGVLQGYLID